MSHPSVTLTAALHRLLDECNNTLQLCDKLNLKSVHGSMVWCVRTGMDSAAEAIGKEVKNSCYL